MQTDFDAYGDTYDAEVEHAIAFAGRDHRFYLDAKARMLLALAGEHVGSLGRLRALDVGCGHGAMHELLTPLGELVGVDVSSRLIAAARARNPDVEYVVSDGSRLPFPDAHFDVVFTVCVLHHVDRDERQRFVSEMARVARPGGLVAAFEHNPVNPFTRLVVRRCAFDEGVELVPRRDAERLLESTGGAARSSYLLFVPSRNRWLRRVEDAFAPVPFGAQYCSWTIRP